jgi:acyl-CoA synthetase (AMP-forming)/AMP-acid ligase II
MNKKLNLSKGWIRSQSVGKFKEDQEVLCNIFNVLTKAKIVTVEDSTVLIQFHNGTTDRPKEDLLRLVITDGERTVPLQNEDWQEAIDKGLIDSETQLDYFVIERKSKNGPSIIRLGRIYKPNEKERKIAEAAYIAGAACIHTPRTFEDYWREVNQQLEIIE